jgi:hypothetical protein
MVERIKIEIRAHEEWCTNVPSDMGGCLDPCMHMSVWVVEGAMWAYDKSVQIHEQPKIRPGSDLALRWGRIKLPFQQ